MGHVFKRRDSEDQVIAWTVREAISVVKGSNFLPDDILPFVKKRDIFVSRDHKDNVLIQSARNASKRNVILAETDVLVINPGFGPSRGELVILSGWEFESRYEEVVEVPVPETPEYAMVLPFITVTSKGGIHEDEAYTAGWEMGLLYGKLAWAPHEMQIITIRTENVPQADLILMHYGYTSAKLEQDPGFPDWTQLVLIPKEEGDGAN